MRRVQLRQQRPHRRVGEDQLAAGEKSATASSRFSMTDSNRSPSAARRQRRWRAPPTSCALTASNELPRSRELLPRQVEPDVELAASEPRQAALDDVNRPQHPLREQHRDQRRRSSSATTTVSAAAVERRPQLVAHQQRRHADADRRRTARRRPAAAGALRASLLGVDRPQLRERASASTIGSRVLGSGDAAALRASGSPCATATPLGVDDRGVGDVVGE